ncbi:MAG TPA: hypothetical protein VE010_10465 [Thermoanaerobaculia bacterium]|nr:hypothetical protein [Thermoanaerobaculia bacterium]
MSRRLFVLFAAVVLAAPFARASEPEHLDVPFRHTLAVMAPRLDLHRLFAQRTANAVSIDTGDGVNVLAAGMEMLVARIGEDGKPVISCVDNAAAAQRFLDTPLERIQNRKAMNQ